MTVSYTCDWFELFRCHAHQQVDRTSPTSTSTLTFSIGFSIEPRLVEISVGID